MTEHTEVGGSAPRWGPLFGARATGWAQTWEGRNGWGTSVYGHVLAHARTGVGTRVLDCGCGAGRFGPDGRGSGRRHGRHRCGAGAGGDRSQPHPER
jgi:hypothetical protein